MADTVTITIDNRDYEVPKGLNLVDAAKMVDIGIPVFCYHPKMEPVGMCRMCLVELGSVSVNRETGQPDLDANGEPVVRWFPKLQTACTQVTAQGMVVRTDTRKALDGRRGILEFLLTSHPLDCPICDKGGECPLQNLTIAYGPGESRFLYDDKLRLAKHTPLGDLIYLDQERCIQCARCTRFCAELVGDDVLAFHERGRHLQIITISDPPFDTKFSGNTTDICPVGALTTTDFRFRARPWELQSVASLCMYCPVGCNTTADIRQERDAGGKRVIKRIMPRQNESVNEIWICDKGRFGHHHSLHPERLTTPLKRDNGAWIAIDWAAAYQEIRTKLGQYGSQVGFLAGPALSNEDYWEMRRLARLTDRDCELGLWPAAMAGHEQVTQVGVGVGTRLQDMGAESAILVIASDFEEEAPIWWLQVKQAADRGAKVVVANGRPTKLDRYASAVVHYAYGDAVQVLNGFAAFAHQNNLDTDIIGARVEDFAAFAESLRDQDVSEDAAAQMLLGAENLVIFAGGEGLTLEQHAELMQAAANLLIMTGHVARPNNGLIPVWSGGNMQGAFDMGFSSEATMRLLDTSPAMWFIAEADPVSENVQLMDAIAQAEFVVVSTQFMTPTAEAADLVLPVQSFAEREGSYTNGMRRVQRFYMAQTPLDGPLPGWKAFASIGAGMPGGEKPRISPALVMRDITQHVLRYASMSYPNLALTKPEFPDVGGLDMYYGGTAYRNKGGLGIQWATNAEKEKYQLTVRPVRVSSEKLEGLLLVPVQLLYDRGTLFVRSDIMHNHVPAPYAALSPRDAANLGIVDGIPVTIAADGLELHVIARVSDSTPDGVLLLPRQLSQSPVPAAPTACTVRVAELIEG